MTNKYHNRPTDIGGQRFDSRAEARRYDELKLLEMAGAITDLTVHPRYEIQGQFKRDGALIRAIYYEGDFSYTENGRHVCEDVKGVETEAFKLKRKLFWKRYPGVELRIIKA